MGLMQLMPETAAMMGVQNPFDAAQNILGGTRYLRGLLDLYGGNLNNALAAYNAGPGQVADRVPDIPETRSFVDAVLDAYQRYEDGEER
jgi:soluble lytic murein transglycosylase-like protein